LVDLADDCVFHFGGDGPNSGDHKGREAIAAALIKNFELTAGNWALDVRGIHVDDDHAAVVLQETASRPDGASIALDEVHILRLRDGKVVDLWDLPEDIQAHDHFSTASSDALPREPASHSSSLLVPSRHICHSRGLDGPTRTALPSARVRSAARRGRERLKLRGDVAGAPGRRSR
jgi:ketosteroid isomerase-like protein